MLSGDVMESYAEEALLNLPTKKLHLLDKLRCFAHPLGMIYKETVSIHPYPRWLEQMVGELDMCDDFVNMYFQVFDQMDDLVPIKDVDNYDASLYLLELRSSQ